MTNSVNAQTSFFKLKCNFHGCVCFDFCLQDNDPEDGGNSASHCASSEFTDRSLYEDSQLGTGSAASGSGSALSGSLGSGSNETSGSGTGREVRDLDVWCFAARWLAHMLVIQKKIL